MGRTVDEHVVEMRFNNQEFEKRAHSTMLTLDNLKSKLDFTSSNSKLNSISSAINNNISKVSFSPVTSGLDAVQVKFSALQTISDQMWRNLTNGAMRAGKKLISALSTPLQLIEEGGKNRAKNIANAKFMLKGLSVEWSEIEDDINYGVKDTAYGLDSAARVAAQLVASQVSIGDNMKAALRGISGVAAMTNSTYDDIGRIFTQVAGQGRLMGDQLLQLSSRGLNAASTLGKALGKTESEIRTMVSKGEIDFDTFSKAMDDAFGEHAKAANETFEGSLSNVKAALARTGVDVATSGFEGLKNVFNSLIPLINNFNKKIKPVTTAISKAIMSVSDILVMVFNKANKLVEKSAFSAYVNRLAVRIQIISAAIVNGLRRFVELNGIKDILQGISNVIEMLLQPLRAIKNAFVEAFPAKTKTSLIDFSRKLSTFTRRLWMSVDAQEGLTNIVKAFLKPLKSVAEIIKWLLSHIGDAIIYIHDFLDATLSLFSGRTFVINNPFEKIFNSKILQYIKDKFPAAIKSVIASLGKLFNKLKDIWTRVKELPQFKQIINDIKNVILGVLGLIQTAFEKLGKLDLSEKINVDSVVGGIETALQKLLDLKDAIKGFFTGFKDGKNDIDLVSGSIGTLRTNLTETKNLLPQALNSEDVTSFFDKMKEKLGTITQPFRDAFKKASEFFKGISAGKIVLGAFGVGIDVLLFRFASLTGKVTKLVKTFTGFFGRLSGNLKAIKKAIDSYRKATTFKVVIAGFIALAASLSVLAIVATKYSQGLMVAAGILLTFVAVFGFFTIAMSSALGVLGAEQGKNIAEIFKGLSYIILGVSSLAFALILLSGIEFGDLVKGLFAISVLVLILYQMVDNLAKAGLEAIKGAGILLIIAGAVGMLAISVAILAAFPVEKVGMAGLVVIAMIVALGAISKAMSDLTLSAGAGLLMAVISLKLFVTALAQVLTLDFDSMKEHMYDLIAVFVIFGLLIASTSVIGEHKGLEGGGAMLMAVTALLVLTGTLMLLAKFPEDQLGKALINMAIVTAILFVIMALLPTLSGNANTDGIKIMLAVVVSIWVLCKALAVVASFDIDHIAEATKSIVAIMIILGGLMYIMRGMAGQKINMGPIIALCLGIAVMAISLAVLASVGDMESIAIAAGSMFAVLISMAAFMSALKKLNEGKDASETFKFIVTLLGIVIAFAAIEIILEELADIDVAGILPSLGALLAVLAMMLTTMAILKKIKIDLKVVGALAALVVALIGIGAALIIMAGAFASLAAINWSNVWQGLAAIGTVLGVLLALSALLAVGSGFSAVVLIVLVALIGTIYLLGGAFIVLAKGVDAATTAFMKFMVFLQAAAVMFLSFVKTVRDNAAYVGESMALAGVYFIQGFINGLKTEAPGLLTFIETLFTGLPGLICKILKIHSPSLLMTLLGEYTMQGYNNGVESEGSKTTSIIGGIFKGLLGQFGKNSEELKKATNEGNVDLSDMVNTDNISSKLNSAKSDAQSGMDGLKSIFSSDSNNVSSEILSSMGLDSIGDSLDVPVSLNMDSGSQDLLNSLGGLKNGTTVQLAADTNASYEAVMSQDQKNMWTQTNQLIRDTKNEMINMKTQMKNMSNSISNMKLYLDGNKLVGGLVGPLSKAQASAMSLRNQQKPKTGKKK